MKTRFQLKSQLRSELLPLFFPRLVLGVLLIFITLEGKALQGDAFQGSIDPREPRIKDFKERISEENPNFPEEMHLYFQELTGDYAVFYDLDGRTVYYQYRRNKWDYDAIERVHNLFSGRSYRVRGDFLGIFYTPKNLENKRMATRVFVPTGEKLTREMKKEEESIPVYRLKDYTETYSDSIIFQSPDNEL